MDFKLNDNQKKVFLNSLKKCGDCVDIHGWRYSKDLGAEDFSEIDVENSEIQKQFYVCVKFLRSFFTNKSSNETISSDILRDAAEYWWELDSGELTPIENGIMLVAIVACGLAPKDLWLSMDIVQKAHINVLLWRKFCDDHDFNFDWDTLNSDPIN